MPTVFTSNYISSTKYNKYNFLPLCLIMQFTRMSNIYFLIVTVLQSIPAISPLKSYTAIVPLVFVLGTSMIREAVEDYIRHKQDQISNSQDIYVSYQNDKKKSDLESMSSFKKG